VIEAADGGPVIFNRLAGGEEVIASIGRAGLVWQRIQIQQFPGDRVDPGGRNNVSGKRLPAETAARGRLNQLDAS